LFIFHNLVHQSMLDIDSTGMDASKIADYLGPHFPTIDVIARQRASGIQKQALTSDKVIPIWP